MPLDTFTYYLLKVGFIPPLRAHLVSVMIVAALLGGMVVAQAAGVDVFGAIGRWTDETFHFILSNPNHEDIKEGHLFQEAFLENGVDPHIVPTRIPEGFEASEPSIIETELSLMIITLNVIIVMANFSQSI